MASCVPERHVATPCSRRSVGARYRSRKAKCDEAGHSPIGAGCALGWTAEVQRIRTCCGPSAATPEQREADCRCGQRFSGSDGARCGLDCLMEPTVRECY